MRLIRTIPVVWLFIGGICLAQGQEGTLESLSGKRVRSVVKLSIDQAGANPTDFFFRYRADNETVDRRLGDNRSFLASDDIMIEFADYNPLKYRLKVEAESFDDPAFLAMKQFLEALKKFTEVANTADAALQKDATMSGTPAGQELQEGPLAMGRKDLPAYLSSVSAQAGETRKPTLEAAYNLLQDSFKSELDRAFRACSEPTMKVESALKKVHKELSEARGPHGLRDFAKLQDGEGLGGVRAARDAISNRIGDIDERLKSIESAMAEIEMVGELSELAVRETANLATVYQDPPAEVTALRQLVSNACEERLARATALAFTLSIHYKDGIGALLGMKRSLQALDSSLRAFDNNGKWQDDTPDRRDSNYVFFEYLPSDEKGAKVGITATALKMNTETAELVEDWSVSSTLRLRHYQAVVPEIGAGFFYTPLEVPKYGTKDVEGGGTVIADAGTDKGDGGVALFLNLLWRWNASTFVYPVVQLGVGTDFESPSLAAGLGLRFTKLGGWSLSGGWVNTWYKDLETLSVGDPVDGTAALEKDLRTTDGGDWYVAVLYNWKIGD